MLNIDMGKWLPWIVVTALLLAAAGLGSLVILRGGWSEELNLASAIAGGLVVAIAVTVWEILVGRRAGLQREQRQTDRKKATSRLLTTFAGSELSNIASQLQVQGIDSEGRTIELFADSSEALRAFENPESVQKLVVALGLRSRQHQPGDQLTINSWDSIRRFYGRFAQQFDHMLGFFISTDNERALEAFLDLWRLQRSHAIRAHYIWQEDREPGWTQNLVEEGAPKAAYVGTASQVLHAYEELLKAIDEIPSGVPSRRERYAVAD